MYGQQTAAAAAPVIYLTLHTRLRSVAAAARRGEGAHAELATVLGYVHARVLAEACTDVPLDHNAVDADGLITDETTVRAITVP